jgi:DHA1 family tetracycline resistance protein-like MFS transporter
MQARLSIIFMIVLIDMVGFGIIIPLLPYYASSFGSSPLVVGLLIASYSLAQMIGAPILSRFSDQRGRRPALIISSAGAFIGYMLWGLAGSIFLLFLSRTVAGLMAGNLSVAQAYISDITTEKNRARGMGLVGAAFGLGLIIGPAVGGILFAIGGYSLPGFFAAGLSLTYAFAVFFLLPESLTPEVRQLIASKIKVKLSLFQALRMSRLGALLQFRFFFGVAFAIFESIFTLFAQYQLGLSETVTGLVLAYVGLISVLVQGLGIGKLAAKYSDDKLLFFSTVLITISFLLWAFTPSLLVLMLVMVPLAIAGGIYVTIINTAISRSISPNQVGAALGLSTAVDSGTRVIAPVVGGFVFGAIGTFAPGVLAAVLTGYLVFFSLRQFNLRPGPAPIPATVAQLAEKGPA